MARIRTFVSLLLTTTILSPPISLGQTAERQTDMPVNAEARSEVIDGVLKNLNDFYIFPDVAKKAELALRERAQKKEYDRITSATELVQTLTNHLREVSHDKHLSVGYDHDPIPVPGEARGPAPAELERARHSASLRNFGFEKVEHLAGNVGYFELRGFLPVEWAGETAAAAMAFLAHADSLIIDLRRNGGGGPDMVILLSSYLFSEKPVLLTNTYFREGDRTIQRWTRPDVPGKRHLNKDVYILTSSDTFSAAESFTYSLQALKRATVVGERTGGGAHMVSPRRINEHFFVAVPMARAINPITNTNWEGKGITPDISVPAEQALKTAHLTAIRKALDKTADDDQRMQLRSIVETLEKELGTIGRAAR